MNIDGMTPEEKRIKIAEAVGWRNVRRTTILKGRVMREGVFGIPPYWPHEYTTNEEVPRFTESLDAIAEAEKTITNDGPRWLAYTNAITDATGLDYEIHATAAQKADAFLLSLP